MVRQVKCILSSLHDLKNWEKVPFPSPLQSNFDYVYTIDADEGVLIITRPEMVGDLLQPVARQMQLSCLDESNPPLLDLLDRVGDNTSGIGGGTEDVEAATTMSDLPLKGLDIHPGPPTALNELQFHVCLDFCFVWKSFLDDPTTWRYPSRGFHTFAIGLLRIAAWDLEVSPTLTLTIRSTGRIFLAGKLPKMTFSGSMAISKARSFLAGHAMNVAHLIIMSIQHIAFAGLLVDLVLCTLPSANYILTSDCWKPSLAHREQMGVVGLPPEITDMVLHSCTPKDALALSQASFIFQKRYYSTIPQFPALTVQFFKYSVTCCGEKLELHNSNYTHCQRCYTRVHTDHTGPPFNINPSTTEFRPHPQLLCYLCSSCKNNDPITLLPGGIHSVTRRYPTRYSKVRLAGSTKFLRLRLGKPSHLRPELRLLEKPPHHASEPSRLCRSLQRCVFWVGIWAG
ncbi:hypothetical protein AJ79_00242 [Helicocarpus griseus UAMH5409]|uniref:Uncharacterized protein n=1 Tax=Helicocarpus griseus UAMH5409 TaxID=1447875 RepID=A0A2B7YCL7_9EURO|nr:hypothetical protein AJ79_00242 [Helicocarpus griseus UAMH5409]